jgi:predicted signal transduction protein with EAL and GGDEF domain
VGPKSEEVSVSAKIGITNAPVDGIEVDVLMKHANLAMYRAKNITHNDYSFYKPGLDADSITRHALEQEMKHALQRNEFELYYQRFVNLEKRN